jgi:CBS domain-containing protein
MYGQRIKQVMERERMLTAPPYTTVSEAARQMADKAVSAVLVLDNGDLTGIFTERDAVFRVVALDRDPRKTTLADVMTPRPITISQDKTFGQALALMHERRIRHVPASTTGKVVGVVTARDALDPDMEEFICEAQRRQGMRT